MSVTQAVQNQVKTIPPGRVFGYQAVPEYAVAPAAVVKALGRLVKAGEVQRLSKGQFYIPQKGILGARKPSDDELIRSVLYKGTNLRGYITGLALYNKLGLTTQVPRTITVVVNGGKKEKDFGTIKVKTLKASYPIKPKDVMFFQYLDVLRDIKRIPDTDINKTLKIMQRRINELGDNEQGRLAKLASAYYPPQVRALAGLLFSSLKKNVASELKRSLNPTTVYRLNLKQAEWPMAKDWNIH